MNFFKIFIFTLCFIFISSSIIFSEVINFPDKNIKMENKKETITFFHKKHEKVIENNCNYFYHHLGINIDSEKFNNCHKTKKLNDNKKVFHSICITCHKQNKVKTSYKTCHKKQ